MEAWLVVWDWVLRFGFVAGQDCHFQSVVDLDKLPFCSLAICFLQGFFLQNSCCFLNK